VSPRRDRRRPRRPPQDRGKEALARDEPQQATARDGRRPGIFGGSLVGPGESALPPIGRSLGRGFLTVASQPALALVAVVTPVVAWLVLLAIGFEGLPNRLVDVLAMPPISTYFDLGTGTSRFGLGPAFLVFLGVALLIRTVVYSLLAGSIVEALTDGRVSRYGLLLGVTAIPTMLLVQVASFTLIVVGNLFFPVLGPGIGFLGFVAALVAGLYFLGFAPTAAIRERRPVMETVRRSARAAMLPGGRHLLLCALYFFLALPVVLGLSPGGSEITANPTLATWVFVLLANVVHLGFMATFAYRWIVAEPRVPEQPVRRRPPAGSAPRRR
jgi:hypothetical protein